MNTKTETESNQLQSAASDEVAISMSKVNKWFGNFHVLKDIDLSIYKGERIVICGPSGSGKSTLIRCINRLEEHQDGDISVNGVTLDSNLKNIHAIRSDVGMVFQSFNLFPHLTVEKNVTFGIQALKNKTEIALEFLQLFKVDHLKNKYPHEISGGEQQRVALARSMAPNPNLLLLDEPFSALDEKLKMELHKETKKIFKEKGLTVVIVSHDKQEAQFFSDRIFTIENGKALQIG